MENNIWVKTHMKLLGLKVEDKVTKFKGVVTCISFDLYGCIQAIVTAPSVKSEKGNSQWCDVSRLKIISKTPVMGLPNYEYGVQAEGRQGAAEKLCIRKNQ